MKITFIYHLYENSTNLEKSIKSLLNQTSKSFEIIFIDDFASDEVKTILNSFDLSDKKFKIVRLFENYGRSFSYNLGLEKASGSYVYFAESKNIFEPDFVKTIINILDNKKYDFIGFKTNINNVNDDFETEKEITKEELSTNASFIVNCAISIRNKVFKKSFLEKKKINFVNYKNLYPIYLFDVLNSYETAFYSSKKLLNLENGKNSVKYTYNLYNILESALLLSYRINESQLDYDTKNNYLVWLPKLCIGDFLVKMFDSYSNEKTLSIAINKAWETLEKIDPSFRNNKSLDLLKNPELKEYICSFKPSFNYVKKNLIRG
ncbi:MAG: glycosyltransferase family 2 protein [Malacoplasma sp.]|nr:glycosyltransferase family 2 protein [Malacoplasma sp.]